MFELIYVTNRHLSDDFLDDVKFVLETKKPDFILLREKDLDDVLYKKLSKEILDILKKYKTKLIVHTNFRIALDLNIQNIHFSFYDFKKNIDIIDKFKKVGVSIHSIDELLEVQKYGVDYVIAGHIFDTKSHKDEKPRGTQFLEEICQNSKIKVYAIGGINFENLDIIMQTKANGACMMRCMLDIS
ncbi:thiamine monophosphate synthase/TENI family protein [Campylobacter pinnipediorum subsp. pinnipediorum]|uniref:thiamine phosphate synthase n=1 Tax=Campylobacter pinnipediorum TaxID=1965231 RepID=UPI000995415F|nr:thiamine phosphate synthase [Campylobacter pinnipediorum]AQW84646.1 thiamine monophosphate synthase/TENI family protein [Campylobacter pinnipediorum subsp. pinnipediorum]